MTNDKENAYIASLTGEGIFERMRLGLATPWKSSMQIKIITAPITVKNSQ